MAAPQGDDFVNLWKKLGAPAFKDVETYMSFVQVSAVY